jgi:uncharacterized protein YfaS (alpha-2-macroglobulin family)
MKSNIRKNLIPMNPGKTERVKRVTIMKRNKMTDFKITACRSYLYSILLMLFVSNLVSGVPYEYNPADRSQLEKNTRSEVRILPTLFLREYDPITVFFDNDVQKNGAGPLDDPSPYITMRPEHPGEYRWIDSRTIEFRPTIPWEPLKNYKISTGNITRELITLLATPQEVYPSPGSTELEPITKIGLTFKQNVDREILARLIAFETSPLPGVDRKGSKTMSSGDYQIKKMENSGSSYTYWFIFNSPVGYGLKLRTILRLADNPNLTDAQRIYTFDTRAEFTIERAGTYQQQYTVNPSGVSYTQRQAIRMSVNSPIIIDFTSPPADINMSVIKNFLNFTPSLEKFEWRCEGKRLIVTPEVNPEQLYQISIMPIAMKDNAGRSLMLKKPCTFYFYAPQEKSVIRWQRGFGIIERFGPQHFPLQISGVNNIDLRIYKIDPLHKAFWPFPRTPVVVNESKLPPGPGEEPPVESDIKYSLSSYDIATHIRMLGSPHYSAVLDCKKLNLSKYNSIDLKPALSSFNGDKPGTFLIGYRKLDGSDERSFVRITSTDLCLSTIEARHSILFSVSSYSSAKMVSDAEIVVEAYHHEAYVPIIKGSTDNNGFFQFNIPSSLEKDFNGATIKRVIVKKGDDVLVLDTHGPESPLTFTNNHWYQSSEWLQWITSKPYSDNTDRSVRAYIRTERPLYRPEEKVYIKGYIRDTYQGKILFPENKDYTLRIMTPSGAQYDSKVKLSSVYSFDHEFKEDDLPTGDYRVILLCTVASGGQLEIGSTEFSMEAYRIPRFEVKLNGPEKAPNDRPVTINLISSYYAGGSVANQNVSWKVTSYPYFNQPENVKGYILSSDNRYGGVDQEREQGVQEENNTTNDDGSATITVNPQSSTNGSPRKYIVEATVTDADEQSVSNYHTLVTLPPFVLGMKIDRCITRGSTISPQIIAIDVNGKFLKGQKVNVTLKKMSWISYLAETDFSKGKPKYITNENVDIISEKTCSTDSIPVSLDFKDLQSGVYILEMSSKDRLGRLQTVKADLFLGGDQQMAWKKAENFVFETITDKKEYQAGQTAQIILKSPYLKAMALAVVELPDNNLKYEWITITNGQADFSLGITPEMAPRVPVSFLLMRPRIDERRITPEGVVVDPGKPETIANTTWLTVKPAAYTLNVGLGHAKTVRPGSEMEMTITLADFEGKPASGEVALWLVDEAVLALKKDQPIKPLTPFIEQVNSRISMRDSRNMALGNLQSPETPGGDGEEGEESNPFGAVTVRKNFKTVPYWNPSIQVDKSGKAVVKIKMSDDLTNFAVRAVAVSGQDRFGSSSSTVGVRLPVLVQPALPRFVRIGDKLKAGGIARVVEGENSAGIFKIVSDGLIISTQAQGACDLSKTKAQQVYADMVVPSPAFDKQGNLLRDSVTVGVSVVRNSDNAGDGFSVKIPLYLDRQFIETTRFSSIAKGKDFTWKNLPQKVRDNALFRNLMVSDQIYILKALSGMNSLISYPYGCTEQRVSQSYPSLAYREIWNRFGLESPDPKLHLRVQQTMEYLARVQSSDGLFGYWPGSKPYVYLTAYVLEFLAEVKKANETYKSNYGFDGTMYSKAIDALKRSLRTDYSGFLDGYKDYERAVSLYALMKAGVSDVAYAREIAESAEHADAQAQAKIMCALSTNRDLFTKEIKSVEKLVWNQTVYKQENGKEVFAGLQQRNFGIGERVHVGEISSIASIVSALSQQEKISPKLPEIVDELVRLGRDGDWGNTQANSQALFAIHDYIMEKKNQPGEFSFDNGSGTETISIDAQKGLASKNWASDDAGVLKLTSGKADSFQVRMSQKYLPVEPGYSADPQQHGFVVKREFILIKKDQAAEKVSFDKGGVVVKLAPGDIVEEHLQVQNPESRLFIAVSSPIAAGLEPMNPKLETSGSDAQPSHATTSEGDYQAFLDDQVTYFFENMRAGTYDFYFRMKATTEGEFTHPPARAEMMYSMEKNGSSAGVKVIVADK